MYPRLRINLQNLEHNVEVVRNLCQEHGVKVTGVTKVFGGDPTIAEAYIRQGITMLGDSRIRNLELLQDLPAEKWLIRPPMPSEISDLIRYADASLESEIETLRTIDAEAERQARTHRAILMVDLGDIREGWIDKSELIAAALEVEQMQNVMLYGIGVNLTCFSFVQYDTDKLTELADLACEIESQIGRELDIVSGGNSATIDLMLRGGIPSKVNNLRLGESLLFGKERAKYTFLPGTHSDVFTLECEIVELKHKPSLPWGEIGVDSYGHTPEFVDRGPSRLKAICALGKQDFDLETTVPCDPQIIMLGASSDHLMLDITDSEHQYRVGDIVKLKLGYFSTMRATTSRYVSRTYIK